MVVNLMSLAFAPALSPDPESPVIPCPPDGALLRRALVVEDEKDIAHLISQTLVRAGFEVTARHDGLSALAAARETEPELVTMDLSIGGMDGFETIRQLRSFSDAFIVIVSSLVGEPDVVQGFATGADDFVRKPFRAREFRAHIDAYLRRARDPRPVPAHLAAATSTLRAAEHSAAAPAEAPRPEDAATHALPPTGSEVERAWIERDGLRVNPLSRQVTVDGRPVKLTRSEFQLLSVMLGSGRRVRSKASLALELRQGQRFLATHVVTDADRHSVEVHMANLRRKLGESLRSPRWIATVRGVGYQLCPAAERAS